MSTLFIIISVLNEAENICTLANNCKKMLEYFPQNLKSQFIFINDGCTDKTVEYIQKYFTFTETQILHHVTNRGPGAAFATAFSFLENNLKDADYVLTMEGDNTSSPELVNKMFYRMHEGFDVILASPYMYGGSIINTSVHRKFLSFFSNLFLKELLGLNGIFTMSSFFRLYKGALLRKMQIIFGSKIIESTGFEGVVELLMKMVFLGVSISEIPLILDTSKRQGKSKMKIIKTSLHLLLLFMHKSRWKNKATQYLKEGIEREPLPRTL